MNPVPASSSSGGGFTTSSTAAATGAAVLPAPPTNMGVRKIHSGPPAAQSTPATSSQGNR
eukprot:GSA25T00007142001.1